MDGVLSQEEISALLNNPDDANKNDLLTDAEKDAIGEIGNISMGKKRLYGNSGNNIVFPCKS